MKSATAATVGALLLVLSCSRKGASGPPRVPVTVARAEQRPVPYEIVATGTAEPRQTVAVQSQVTGVLTRVAFREGDEVAPGQVLFQIDPRPFHAALDQARAMLARDAAQAENAALDATRYADLVKQDYVTKQDYDAKRANAEALQAAVRADSASVAFFSSRRRHTRSHRDWSSDVCSSDLLFNTVAIAARYAQRHHKEIERVAVVDWDVHHGNGTQGIFYDDPSVFFFSAHQYPWYPGDRKSTRLNSSHDQISYAVFCLKKKT